jgi:lysophospholipase L1-like esterase
MTPLRRLAPALAAAVLLACGSDDDPEPGPGATGGEELVYVAIGDSAGFGVGGDPPLGDGGYPRRLAQRMRAAGRTVRLENLSVPGALVRNFATQQLPRVVALSTGGTRVDLITVCLGGNDGDDTAPPDFRRDLDALLAGIAPLGAKVVVCNVPDVSLTPRYQGDPARAAQVKANVVALNAELAAAAAARGFPVVDIYAVSQQLHSNPGLISPIDGFHPNAAGYEVWAEAMWPTVKAAAGIP